MVKTYYKTTWYSQKQIRYFGMRIDYSHSSMKWVVYSTFSLIPVQLISGHPRWFSALPCIASSFNVRRSYRIQCFRVVPFLHIIRLFVWDNAFVTHGQHILMVKKLLWSIAHRRYGCCGAAVVLFVFEHEMDGMSTPFCEVENVLLIILSIYRKEV